MLCAAETGSFFESISLGQILIIMTFILGFSSATKKLCDTISEWFNKKLTPALMPLIKKQEDMSSKLDCIEADSYKQYLVLFMSQLERGEVPDEVERALFDETYAKYTNAGGNSYIHRKYEKLQREGKI